jgi:carboxypeptidase PM20D1
MKKSIKYFAFILLALIAVLVFNTVQIKSKQMLAPVAAERSLLTVSDSAIHHLAAAVRFRTVSYADIAQMDSAQFDQFVAYIAKTYPLVHSQLTFERVNSYALLYEWKGKNPNLKPALLMGHYDVVPVIQGTERLWEHKPFDGDLANGYLYGRGTLDDKTTVMGILEAVEHLLREGYQPERTFYLSFGHDEEVSGVNGAQKVVKLLESRKLDFEYILDEGGSIKPDGFDGLNKPIAFVGVAEKGYLTLQLTVNAEGGHSSMPPPRTAIGMLAEAVDRLEKNPFPTHLEGAMDYMQDYLAPEMPFATRLAMANKWLFSSVIINTLAKSPKGNASVRTTTAPTIIDAGVKDNVLPIEATAMVNFRIHPSDSIASVISYVKKIINNDQVKVEQAYGYGSNPSAVSDTATLGFRLIHQTIKRHNPDALVTPFLVLGATDSRYFKNLSKNIYRFMPVKMNDEDLKRFHGTNERISVEDFKNVIRFYVDIVKGS